MVSFLVAVEPEVLTTASENLVGIGSAIRAANTAAAGSTTQLLTAGQA